MDELPTPVAHMLPFPSTSPPSRTASRVAADRLRQRTAADTAAAHTPQPVPAAHGADLSALSARQPTRPRELTGLPPEVQADITRYLTPRHIGLYANAFDPSVVPTPERSAAALSVLVEEAGSLDELEAFLDEAIELHRSTRHRPIHGVLCVLRSRMHGRASSDDRQRVDAMVDRCLEVAQEMPPSKPRASSANAVFCDLPWPRNEPRTLANWRTGCTARCRPCWPKTA
ncbi:hypothetical protein [Xylophilus sp. GOD-11R]|uniref:hypothetical protein n=1 Tax=Xylophilus sp. GOD-11R TaxID=3089814 RepID=UPI00298CEF6C|nr:hypothetical protein [Xylophilus sp. GOD-11R]WPB56761.1 hypothetical protein R9X41_21910 [Xylophilus sp. GOD-11R]